MFYHWNALLAYCCVYCLAVESNFSRSLRYMSAISCTAGFSALGCFIKDEIAKITETKEVWCLFLDDTEKHRLLVLITVLAEAVLTSCTNNLCFEQK